MRNNFLNKVSITFFALFLMLLMGSFEQVSACSCIQSAPCQDYDRADVVFVGKVVGSKYQKTVEEYVESLETSLKPKKKSVTYDVGEIYFEVTEKFGEANIGSRVTIHSTTGGGDCGYWFERGKTYIVFASREGSETDSGISSLTFGGDIKEKLKPEPNRLWTTICSGTRSAESSEAVLKYLRNLPKDGSGGMILGRIDESIKDYSEENLRSKPMPEIQVKAQQTSGDQRAFYGTTDKNGYYEIKVPPGKYLVTLLDSTLYYGELSDNEPLEIADKKCELKTFYVVNDSRIEGKVIDADGNPVTDITIDLIPVGKDRNDQGFDYELSQLFNEGKFTFAGLALGRYQISLNYTDKPDEDSPYPTFFYPNTANRSEAEVFEIKYGTKIKDLIFQLPPKLKRRKITGQVLWKNGKPAKNAEVQLVDVEFDDNVFFDRIKTNANGEFEAVWLEGRKYKLKVIVWQKSTKDNYFFGVADTESEVFTLDETTPKFKLVLNNIDPKERSITRTTVRSN